MEGLNVNNRGIHSGRRDEFAHCPEPSSKGDWGYYLTFNDHQHQGLLQSKDMGRRCFYTANVKLWLDTYPPNYFELYDIYRKFNAGKYNSQYGCVGALSGRTGSLHHLSKAVLVIKPDGTKLHFGSGREAARVLGIHQANIAKYVRGGKPLVWGKCKGHQFFFIE